MSTKRQSIRTSFARRVTSTDETAAMRDPYIMGGWVSEGVAVGVGENVSINKATGHEIKHSHLVQG